MKDFFMELAAWATTRGISIVIALLILAIGWGIISSVTKKLKKGKYGKKMDPTVRNFVANFCNIGLKIILVVTVIVIMGVPEASIAAVLASAGVTIGLALQGGLSNIASGIILLITRPFSIGDFVTVAGESGTVTDINIYYTTILTPDNKTITVPNSAASTSNITNFSIENKRRVDITALVAYGTDTELVKNTMLEIANANEKVLRDPAPAAVLTSMNDKGVEFALRMWVENSDYWTVHAAVNEALKASFEEKGISVPKMQVNIHQAK
ncbi:MAG: mechanosensitive ion channel family protein [Clostridia bacterium]|nr:mechanosensitive ion channel family protein [Clostridia bacterium]